MIDIIYPGFEKWVFGNMSNFQCKGWGSHVPTYTNPYRTNANWCVRMVQIDGEIQKFPGNFRIK